MEVQLIEVKLNPDVTPTGSDLSIVNAARRSFDTRSEWDTKPRSCEVRDGLIYFKDFPPEKTLKEKDKRLIEFLARGMTAKDFEKFKAEIALLDNNNFPEMAKKLWEWRNTPTHETPFNHTFISFEAKFPLFVARQMVKHRFLIWSEFSGRYIENLEFYRPAVWRGQPDNKKQGSKGEAKSQYHPFLYTEDIETLAIDRFKKMVGTQGVCMEQARMIMPLSTMTEVTWSGTLGAFANMCRLRLHPEAQYESRLVAQQVYEYLKEYYPVSAKALVEGPDV